MSAIICKGVKLMIGSHLDYGNARQCVSYQPDLGIGETRSEVSF
jgi:hypothetical protein